MIWPKRRILFSLFICAWHYILHLFSIILCAQMWLNPRTYTQIQTPTVGQGRVDETPPRSFRYVAVFRNHFTFSGKHLIFSTRLGIFYGWWRSSSWPPSWILPRIRNQVKTAINSNFLCFTWKITHKQALWMVLATIFTFIVERS